MPDDTIEPTPRPKPRPVDKPKPDVAALYKAGSYPEVVAACSSAATVVALNATACTVAACKAKQPAKARRWFAQVGAAKKTAVIKDCDGMLAADKPAADKPATDKPVADDVCKRDPMACQH
jgi:hypothetical protein